jgi:HEAT repeat protein
VGIFDFLRSTPPPAGATGGVMDKKTVGPAKVVADKRAQTYDRLDAIQTLGAMKTADAASALLKRFTYAIDPSITDQEEKELAFQGIVAAGLEEELPKGDSERERALEALRERREQVFETIRSFCARAEQLTWPLKVLRELLPDEAYAAELITILEGFDTEYVRNVDPKVQLIVALEDVKSSAVREAVEPFLDDVNETVRFHAVKATFAQEDAAAVPALVALLDREESVRIKNKVAEGLGAAGWRIPVELRATTSEALRDSDNFRVTADGAIVR